MTATTVAKEKPILFSGEMVRAILADRKTQTRRIMKPQPHYTKGKQLPWSWNSRKWANNYEPIDSCRKCSDWAANSPFGKNGNRLWVRETFGCTDEGVVYRATDPDWEVCEGWKWIPSIHMPRKASRVSMEITNTRVERLHSISETDAYSEGALKLEDDGTVTDLRGANYYRYTGEEARSAFMELWESIYGEDSWKSNPWVWVIEFKRVEAAAI